LEKYTEYPISPNTAPWGCIF